MAEQTKEQLPKQLSAAKPGSIPCDAKKDFSSKSKVKRRGFERSKKLKKDKKTKKRI